MSAPPYMRLYWGDYHRDTRHLSRGEHGAYFLLLSALWNGGGKLPADDTSLAKLALCTPAEWAEIRPTIMAFFTIRRGRLSQKRITAELAKYESTIGKRKMAGRKGGLASAGKHAENPTANAKQKPTKPEPEPEPELDIGSEDKSSDADGVARELNRTAWRSAIGVIMAPGGVSEAQARRFFGALLSEHGLEAKDLIPAISSVADNGSESPRALLTKWAQGIAKRREPSVPPKRQGFV